jgi:hypothetical protein
MPVGIALLMAGCSLVAALICGVRASQAIEPPKARMRLWAVSLFGSAFLFAGIALIVFNYQLPTIEAEGMIEDVSVHSQGRGYRSDITVRVRQGGQASLRASGRSVYFRRGEHVRLRYQGFTGVIKHAQFFAINGKPEGVFQGNDFLTGYSALGLGVFLIFLGWKRYRRDLLEEGSLRDHDSSRATTSRLG